MVVDNKQDHPEVVQVQKVVQVGQVLIVQLMGLVVEEVLLL